MAKYFYSKYNVVEKVSFSENGWGVSSSKMKSFSNNSKGFVFNPNDGMYDVGSYKYQSYEPIKKGDVAYSHVFGSDSIERYIAKETAGSASTQVLSDVSLSLPAVKRINYSRGSLISENIIAEEGFYPSDGRHVDGYWYVKNGLSNRIPSLTLDTTNGRTIYENDTYNISGTTKDTDLGNVLSVKYSVNNGPARAIATSISTGMDMPFSKTLIFKNKRFYDGSTDITTDLAESANHTLRVWSEDDQGGKSAVESRTFTVVPNRAPVVTINPLTQKTDQIGTDKITVSGNASDPDGNTLKVSYKVGAGSFSEIYDGAGGAFTFDITVSALKLGDNSVVVRAVDSYGATTTKNLNVVKTENSTPLKKSVKRYKINPPNGEAQGVILWIERDVGDIVVSAEVSMTGVGEEESYQPMTKNSTAFVSVGREEDEFQYEASTAKKKIIVKLTMIRDSVESEQAIRLVSGVLS